MSVRYLNRLIISICLFLGWTIAAGESTAELKSGSLLKISGKNYKVVGNIDSGGYGDIFELKEARASRRRTILKVFRKVEFDSPTTEVYLKFINREISSPYLADIYSVFNYSGKLAVQMEMIHSNLLQSHFYSGLWLLRVSSETTKGIQDIERILGQLLLAMQAIHKSGYIHLDIRPENILIDSYSGNIKLNDFDLLHPAHTIYKNGGPIETSSPEQVNYQAVMPASDYYSVGATLLKLITGKSFAKAISFDNKITYIEHNEILNKQFYRITDYIQFEKKRILGYLKKTVGTKHYKAVEAMFLFIESTILKDPNSRIIQLQKNRRYLTQHLKDKNIQRFFNTTRFRISKKSCQKSVNP